jgi:glycosyltransferase involved in cell wall biosynthesis
MLRLLAVANWSLDDEPTPWADQRIAALRAAGIDVDVLAISCVGDLAGYLTLHQALRRCLTARRYDLVAPLYGSLLALMCVAQRRVPCALSFAGSDLNGLPGAPLARLRTGASQLASVLARGVSVRNPRMREAIWWPAARHRAWVIPSGVDVRHFAPMPRALARARRGLPPSGVRIVAVANGGARAGKRLDLARAAVALLPNATFELFERIPFSAMPSAYASADALVLTSAREGSPNCVKEALACAIPVVSVDVGDVREVVAGLTNCAVVAATAPALAQALARVVADGRGCGDGPARMKALCSIDAMTSRFVDFYRSCVTA